MQYLAGIQRDLRAKPSTAKNIVLDIAMNNVLQVALSVADLDTLCQLMEQADTEIRQRSLLKLFYAAEGE